MTLEVKHTTLVNAGTYPDDGTKPVGTSEWNEAHTITMATDRLLGRVTAGAGAAEELAPSAIKTMLDITGAGSSVATRTELKALDPTAYAARYSGSFTTVDGKTVTVVNGTITAAV